jgi:hypothetical protein
MQSDLRQSATSATEARHQAFGITRVGLRLAAAIALLYARPLSRIVRLSIDGVIHVTLHDT